MVKTRMLRAVLASTINGDRFRRFAPTIGAILLALGAASPTFAQSRSPRVTIIELNSEPVTETWRYQNATLTVPTDTKVTWLNTGRGYHTVTSPEGLFDSGFLESGADWTYEFETPGVYNYFCVPYPWMKGTVIVRERPTPTPSN
ncbi:MAG TPA: plastocyanin/azurin family copper-binding protein [Chloroflexota bacterium]|jgi:plastocyanin|nr:plastocyanin/azurin family copper-binding protein [Chloroflexota bacterium]